MHLNRQLVFHGIASVTACLLLGPFATAQTAPDLTAVTVEQCGWRDSGGEHLDVEDYGRQRR